MQEVDSIIDTKLASLRPVVFPLVIVTTLSSLHFFQADLSFPEQQLASAIEY